MRVCAVCVCLAALIGCKREARDPRPAPGSVIVFGAAARESLLQPGGTRTEPQVANPDEGNAAAISEGERLYGVYNCAGCHANGGGAIGPLRQFAERDLLPFLRSTKSEKPNTVRFYENSVHNLRSYSKLADRLLDEITHDYPNFY